MMIMSVCNSCLQPFRIILEAGEGDLLKQISIEDGGKTCKCPRLCGGRINLIGDATISAMADKLKEPLTLTGRQLYVAVHGLGLPDEIVKDLQVIRAVLLAHKVVSVDLEEVGDRMYLHELQLDNGMTIHLAAGARGAQILKVTKERKPCPPTP
jgi:hypothetical protein